VDETGAVVASYEFDPYGNPVNNIGGAPVKRQLDVHSDDN
jgi:hypothetical protein